MVKKGDIFRYMLEYDILLLRLSNGEEKALKYFSFKYKSRVEIIQLKLSFSRTEKDSLTEQIYSILKVLHILKSMKYNFSALKQFVFCCLNLSDQMYCKLINLLTTAPLIEDIRFEDCSESEFLFPTLLQGLKRMKQDIKFTIINVSLDTFRQFNAKRCSYMLSKIALYTNIYIQLELSERIMSKYHKYFLVSADIISRRKSLNNTKIYLGYQKRDSLEILEFCKKLGIEVLNNTWG